MFGDDAKDRRTDDHERGCARDDSDGDPAGTPRTSEPVRSRRTAVGRLRSLAIVIPFVALFIALSIAAARS